MCDGDPCAGVVCDDPPDDVCTGLSWLTSYSSPGTCSNGLCLYGSTVEICTLGCVSASGDDYCETDTDTGTGTDTDTGTGTDTDTGTGTDTDTGTGTDTDTGTGTDTDTGTGTDTDTGTGTDTDTGTGTDTDTGTGTDTGIGCGTASDDYDGDGWSENDGDCNDCDDEIGPMALEIPANGVDDDCDGSTDEAIVPCDCTSGADWWQAMDMCETTFLFSPDTWHSGTGGDPEALGALDMVTRLGDSTNDLPVHAGCRYTLLSTGIAGDTDPQPGTDLAGGSTPDPAPDYNGSQVFVPDGNQCYDNAQLMVALHAPANAYGFSFDFVYLTTEYPEWLGAGFNDAFYAVIEAASTNGGASTNISYDHSPAQNEICVNSAFFEDPPMTDVSGSGFGWDSALSEHTGGSTGWYRTRWPVDPNEVFFLTFSIHDESDGIFDSTVILDNFRWLLSSPTPGTIQL